MEPQSTTGSRSQHAADADEWREGLRFTEEFHMQNSAVHRALDRLVRRLRDADLRYAVVGAMALNGHGYRRATVDIDILVSPAGLRAFKEEWLGRGYVEQFEGSRGVRDTEDGVPIYFLLSGEYPGDGQPQAVRFPDPEDVAETVDGVSLARLDTLIEMKLASGLSAPHRLRDLADVLELVRARRLPAGFAARLDRSVRGKYAELWHAAQTPGD